MNRRLSDATRTVAPFGGRPLPPLPLSAERWAAVSRRLGLVGQHVRLVELILRGLRDKQVAAEMGLSLSTVRTYLGRIFARTGATSRMDLVLLVLAESHAIADGDAADGAMSKRRQK